MKVRTLQEGFLKEFGLTLRVYDGREFADPTQTLAQVRKKKGSGKDLSVAKNMKVGNLEDKFEEEFGLKVQVAGSDDSYLCDNDLTLAAALKEDQSKLGRRQTSKADTKSHQKSVYCKFVMQRAEFSEADGQEISSEFAEKLRVDSNRITLTEAPAYMSIEYIFENMRGIHEKIENEEKIQPKSLQISMNMEKGFPTIDLQILAEIELGNFTTPDKFEDWFNSHEDKNDLISIAIEDPDTEEEYYIDYVDEVSAEVSVE